VDFYVFYDAAGVDSAKAANRNHSLHPYPVADRTNLLNVNKAVTVSSHEKQGIRESRGYLTT
jgi:hypothetical protein